MKWCMESTSGLVPSIKNTLLHIIIKRVNGTQFFVQWKDIFMYSSWFWNLVILTNNLSSICCKSGGSLLKHHSRGCGLRTPNKFIVNNKHSEGLRIFYDFKMIPIHSSSVLCISLLLHCCTNLLSYCLPPLGFILFLELIRGGHQFPFDKIISEWKAKDKTTGMVT